MFRDGEKGIIVSERQLINISIGKFLKTVKADS